MADEPGVNKMSLLFKAFSDRVPEKWKQYIAAAAAGYAAAQYGPAGRVAAECFAKAAGWTQ